MLTLFDSFDNVEKYELFDDQSKNVKDEANTVLPPPLSNKTLPSAPRNEPIVRDLKI